MPRLGTKLPLLGTQNIGRATYIYSLLLVSLSGCATPDANIGQPVCDQPIPVTSEIWNDLELMREVMSDNNLVYEECISRLRARIDLHDAN